MTLAHHTITDSMRRVAERLATTIDTHYYLAGGTALALQIGHRKSVDLDYFISDDIDTRALVATLVATFGNTCTVTFEERNTLWCTIEGVKASFISRHTKLVAPLLEDAPFRLASISDITVMKLSAVCSREEYKDYFDLACIAEQSDARAWLSLWANAYPEADPTSFLVALGYADKIVPIPLDISEPFLHVDVASTLSRATRDITALLQRG